MPFRIDHLHPTVPIRIDNQRFLFDSFFFLLFLFVWLFSFISFLWCLICLLLASLGLSLFHFLLKICWIRRNNSLYCMLLVSFLISTKSSIYIVFFLFWFFLLGFGNLVDFVQFFLLLYDRTTYIIKSSYENQKKFNFAP